VDVRTIPLTADGNLDLDQPVPFIRVPRGDEPITWRRLFKSSELGPWASDAERAARPRGCHFVGASADSAEALPDLGSADNAVVGKVIDRSYGYHGMDLGTLLKIEATEWFGLPKGGTRDVYFVFVPVGDFQIGNERICKVDPSCPSPVPAVGQETVVLAHPPMGRDRDFLTGRALAAEPGTKRALLEALAKRLGR
jgi:hypothetical protein